MWQQAMLSFLLAGSYYDKAYGKIVLQNSAVLLPYEWFDKSLTQHSEIERVYELITSEEVTFYLVTVFNTSSPVAMTPLTVVYNNSRHVVLVPSPAQRLSFERYVENLSGDSEYWLVLRLYYDETEFEPILGEEEGDFFIDREFDRVSVTYKIPEFGYLMLNKTGVSTKNYNTTYPIMECQFSTEHGVETEEIVLFESDELEEYFHSQNGTFKFNLLDDYPGDLKLQLSENLKVFTTCNLYFCKTKETIKYEECQYYTPLFGIPVDYQLPDEGISQPLMITFSCLCAIFMCVLFAIMIVCLRIKMAKSRRVTDISKNKIKNTNGVRGKVKH